MLRPKYYFIGPNDPGTDAPQIINGAWWKVKNDFSEPLVLMGYSRGAAYCLDVCLTTQRHFNGSRPISALILFDAVLRNEGVGLNYARRCRPPWRTSSMRTAIPAPA